MGDIFIEHISLAIFSFFVINIVAIQFYQMVVSVLRRMEILKQPPHSLDATLQQAITEIKETTVQISRDWKEMSELMRDQQLPEQNIRTDDLNLMNQSFWDRMSWFQEEENNKNEQRYLEMKKKMSYIITEIDSLNEITRSKGDAILKALHSYKPMKENMIDMWSQTEREMIANFETQENKPLEDKAAKSSSFKQRLRKTFKELQKEIRTYSSEERDELLSQFQVIAIQINNDRDILKNTAQHAFAITPYENQQCLENSGEAGEEVLTKKSERSDKYKCFDKILKGIFENMKMTGDDVSGIKNTLDTINGQLDDMYQKIELDCQKNVEQWEEVQGGLEASTEVWKDGTLQLTKMSQILSKIDCSIEHLMSELKEKPDEIKDLSAFDAADQKGSQDHANSECFLKMQNLVHSCSENIAELQVRIENGSKDVSLKMEDLLHQIQFICDLLKEAYEQYTFLKAEAYQMNPSVIARPRFHREVNMNAASGDVATAVMTGADNRKSEDLRLKSPKKYRIPSKIKPPSNPIKKGQIINSDKTLNTNQLRWK